jgi:hypothetical protein
MDICQDKKGNIKRGRRVKGVKRGVKRGKKGDTIPVS